MDCEESRNVKENFVLRTLIETERHSTALKQQRENGKRKNETKQCK